jgi:hypothetical protein
LLIQRQHVVKSPSKERFLRRALNDCELNAQALQRTDQSPRLKLNFKRAQPSASAVWRATCGCHDVTLPSSGKACAAVLALRQALQTAQRREDLDAELREAEKETSRLPATSISDPQAEIAAHLLKWITMGLIDISADDIRIARIGGMTIMPQVAGLVLMLAAALWQSNPWREAS